jgi:hypothetical protein
MIDTILTDSIKTVNQVISKTDKEIISSHNIWMWIAIIELTLIIYLILFRKKKPENPRVQFKRQAKEGDIDFGNIINSSFHVKPLYDELKLKCHPDRFPNDIEKNQIALELFQEISKNKTNYKKLIELKELAKQNLNIKF